MEFEQINEAHVRGTVGTVRLTEVGGTSAARFSVATQQVYRSADGDVVCELTWHCCTAWSGKGVDDLSRLCRGAKVDVTGRLRNQRYTGPDGAERTNTEILVKSLSILS